MLKKQEKYNIAIIGATGIVGESLLSILNDRSFPINNIYAVASQKSKGAKVKFGDHLLTVEALDEFDFSNIDIAFFSAGGSISKEYAPKAASQGCIVIDNTSEFRYVDNIPLIVPEVNPYDIDKYKETNIIANPNCSTIQMLVALKPLHDEFGVDNINVSTYQAVSGSGKDGVEELLDNHHLI
jgi:aspartate-semialdehyde dehydrogenase